MSASFASAMMNAREERLALISASLMSKDFMEKPQMNTNEHESENDAFPFQLRVLEIQNHTGPKLRDSQIVQHLPALHVCDPINHLCIHHDRPECNKVGDKQPDFVPFVEHVEIDLLLKRNVSNSKFNGERIL